MDKVVVGDKFALIDKEDFVLVNQYKWYFDKDGYAISAFKENGKTKNIKMHQLIIGKKNGLIIDHINHNKLDNQKHNLRHITRQANAMNMEKKRGVYWNEQRKTYIIQIRINAKTKHVGCRKKLEDAILLRKKAEDEYFKPIIERSVSNGCNNITTKTH